MFPKYRYMDDWRLEAVARIQMFHSKSQAEFYVKIRITLILCSQIRI